MKHFTYRSLADLQHDVERLGLRNIHFESEPQRVREILTQPVMVGRARVGNAMAIHPMEGCDSTADGRPDTLTTRRYVRFGRGGAKLIWFEATAVRQDGRANARQLWIHRGNVDDYARLLETMLREHAAVWGRNNDVLVPVQLTHSGRYSYPVKSIAYHHPQVDQKTGTPADYPLLSDSDLERLEDDYLEAARLVYQAGFRAVDIKVTHGYLLNELLGARVREGRYGGSLENRARMVRNIIGKIRAEFGGRMMIAMRLGCYDSVPYVKDPGTGVGVPIPYQTPYDYSWGVDREDPSREDLREVKQFIAWMIADGVELLNVSLGCPYYNPHVLRPFEKPDDGNYEQPEHPLVGVDRHFRIAGELQRTFPELPIVGGGYSWLQKYAINAGARNVADGNARFFGLGRGVLAYPEFAAAIIEKAELDELKVCKTLTYCTFLMRQKTHPTGQYPCGCPPFDKEGYGAIMKEARQSQRLAQIRT